MPTSLKKYMSIALAPFIITACSDDNKSDQVSSPHAAVIQTVAADYSGADVQLVDLASGDYDVSSGVLPTVASDYIIASHNADFYHIGRYNLDNIAKYNIADTGSQIYEYSTKDSPEADSNNVYDMVFASDNKAYLINYGSDNLWIVNPKAETEAAFKIGEIDLSAYADSDGITEASAGIIVDGKLFVAMQRINRNNNWSPVDNSAYVAVIDVATDTEIDTNPSDAPENLKGIELTTHNPGHFAYYPGAGLFLQASGDPYGAAYYGRPAGYVGGVTKISTTDYSIELTVDDGSNDGSGENPYGYIVNVAVVDENNGYFIGQASYQNSSLYHFDPATGLVTETTLDALQSVDISTLSAGPDNGLWTGISNAADPKVLILSDINTISNTISLIQNPTKITFAKEEN